MFKKFWLDTILGFLFIIIIALTVTQVTAFKVFDVFDPFGDALADMETTDIVFSQIREDPVAEEELVIINVGNLPRQGIADLVNIINMSEPKVIGMDMFFYNLKADTVGDIALADALGRVENLVMVSKLHNPNENNGFDSIATSHPIFVQNAETAYANFITGAADQEDIKVCRTFSPKETLKGDKVEYALSVKMAQLMNPERVDRFLDRGNDIETINYRGNIMDYGPNPSPITYFALDWYQVLEMQFDPALIKDKAVLFCFLGSEIGNREAIEDKYFTPLNKKYAGKTHADMFGGVVHANAFSMIMSEEYIDGMSEFNSYIIAAIILYLNVILMTYIYKAMPRWYDGLTKVIQMLEAFALFTLLIIVFNSSNYKMDLTASILAVLIVGDALEIFFGMVQNLFTKEGRADLITLKKL
jgi:CHASE2 domain-containing sensor protein